MHNIGAMTLSDSWPRFNEIEKVLLGCTHITDRLTALIAIQGERDEGAHLVQLQIYPVAHEVIAVSSYRREDKRQAAAVMCTMLITACSWSSTHCVISRSFTIRHSVGHWSSSIYT